MLPILETTSLHKLATSWKWQWRLVLVVSLQNIWLKLTENAENVEMSKSLVKAMEMLFRLCYTIVNVRFQQTSIDKRFHRTRWRTEPKQWNALHGRIWSNIVNHLLKTKLSTAKIISTSTIILWTCVVCVSLTEHMYKKQYEKQFQ